MTKNIKIKKRYILSHELYTLLKYLSLKPLQRDDVMRETKTMSFYFRDENAFVDCRRIFLGTVKYVNN